jgi:hypothetical protein
MERELEGEAMVFTHHFYFTSNLTNSITGY